MSAVEATSEPSMEEILSSIRKAISEDHSRANSGAPDPFGSNSPAASAFSKPVEGKQFDTASHAKHDPFAALNAKLDERKHREHNVSPEVRLPEIKTEVRPEPRQERVAPPTPQVEQAPAPRNPFSQPAAANKPAPAPAAPPPQPRPAAHREPVAPPQRAVAEGPVAPSEFKPFTQAFATAGKHAAAPAPQQYAPTQPAPAPQQYAPTQPAPAPQQYVPTQPAPAPRPAPVAQSLASTNEIQTESLLSVTSDAVASAAFNRLSATLDTKTACSKTVEDLVVDILTPILKQWLDQYLPELVEELVRVEIERVARQRG